MVKQGMVSLLKGACGRWGCSRGTEATSALPSLFISWRAFSSKLFIGGLAYHTTEDMLRKTFAEHGDVVDVRIITDRETGKSRGFGFVTFSSDSDAESAKAKLNNQLLDGRYIRVDLASARQPQSSPSAPRSFGNANSTSPPSGFSFTSTGTRPPVVEDWGPIPLNGTSAAQTSTNYAGFDSTNNTFDKGSTDASKGNAPPLGSIDSAHVRQESSMTTNVFGSGGFSSSSVASNTSIYATPFRNATPATSVPETTSTNSGVDMSPNIPKSSPLQGVAADDPLMNSYKAPTGQNSVNYRSTAETGTMFSQASSNNRKVESPTGGKPDFGFFRERSGGGGRPPSVIDLGSATYDFRNFPEFDAKAYKDFKPPSEMDQPKKRVLFQASKLAPKRSETWQSKLTEEAIPPPKGPLFDFGLSSIPDSPPTSEGCSHHGGISLSVNLDELPEAEPVRLPYSIFTARVLPPLDLPWLTPEADNWSEIGKPPRRIEDSPYSPFSPDLKDDPEFWWDPYDFDPEAKLLKQQCVDDTVDTNTKEVGGDTAVQQEPGAGVQQEPGAGVKAVKESEASDPPVVVNAAVS